MSLFNEDQRNTYQAFDWFYTPVRSLISCIISLCLVTLVFVAFYFLTNKCKLPRYQTRTERLFDSIVNSVESGVENNAAKSKQDEGGRGSLKSLDNENVANR